MVFTGIIEKIKGGFTAFVEFITSHLKAALVIAAAVFFVILLFLILTIISRRSLAEEKRPDTEPAADYAFPVEDFFLPYEPDFVPGVLLEREPRDNWTEEDARPFWTDPMEGNEELWRKRIESGIDSLLEQVP